MHLRGIGVIATIAAISLAGCSVQTGSPGSKQSGNSSSSSQSSGSSKSSTVVPLGTSIHVTGDGGLSSDVTIQSVNYHTSGTGDIAQPPANGQYAVADVLIVVHSGQYAFNPLYFKYQAQGSTTYDPLSGNASSAGFDPSLDSGTLNPGQTTRGFVTFDVPKGQGQDIQLTDPVGSVVGEWKL
jgi:hypothetical protein